MEELLTITSIKLFLETNLDLFNQPTLPIKLQSLLQCFNSGLGQNCKLGPKKESASNDVICLIVLQKVQFTLLQSLID